MQAVAVAVLIVNRLVVVKRNLKIFLFQVKTSKTFFVEFLNELFLKMKMLLSLIYKNVQIVAAILRLIESTSILIYVEERKKEKFLTVLK